MTRDEYDHLNLIFAALADPTRRAMLARLARGEATVSELAEPFELSLPTVSKHLQVLQRAGLVSQGRRAQWRPCRFEPAGLKEVDDWIEQYRRLWDERFSRLDEFFDELRTPERPKPESEPQRQGQNPDDPYDPEGR